MAKTKEKPLQDVRPPALSPAGAGNKVSIQTLKQFDKLRTQLVIELDRATINNLVKSYARGQAVATWESSQGKEKIELGGPDPNEQVKYLLEAMKPIHEYNDKLATILTKRLTDQINSGTAPGVMAKGMQETIIHFMKAPVEVPLKGPDGKPKLDKDGNQVVRVYSPEAYANLLSRTLTYSLRNRGYLDHYRKMGSYDGWTSICSDDERSCEPCIDKDGQFFPWDSSQEPPAYHPFCRCRPKAHLSKDAEEGFQGPDDGKGVEVPPVTPVPTPLQAQKIQAWQDWTVNQDYGEIKTLVEKDLETKVGETSLGSTGWDHGCTFRPGEPNTIWINGDLPEASKSHALVGAYGEFLAKTVEGDPMQFLGCSDEVFAAMKDQRNAIFKNVNVARVTGVRVDLEALKKETEENWNRIIQKGKWLPKDTPLSRISPKSQSTFTEAELWHNLKRTNAEFYDMLNAQVRSVSFLSNPITINGQKKAVPLTQYKEAMKAWRASQKGGAIPDEMFEDALDLALRNWFRYGDSEEWTILQKRGSTEAHLGALLEGIHIDPGMVKELGPDIYDYLVKQVSTGAYGEPIKKILTFTGDLKKNLPQEIKIFKDWDEMRNLVQQETGFTISFRNEVYGGRLSGQLAGIDRKGKTFWLDRRLKTQEASQLLTGQYSRLWAEDQAKALKLRGSDAPIRAFFSWDKDSSLDELDKMLSQMNIAAQSDAPIKFEQLNDDIEKNWGFVWQGHGSRWGLKGKPAEEDVASAIESYLQQLKEKGVDLTWAEDPGNTRFSITRKIQGKEQDVDFDNYMFWFKRDLELQLEKLDGADQNDVVNKWGDIYQYLKAKWWRQARATNFSGNIAQAEPAEKVAAFITTLYKDEKAVKEMAPKCYDRFVSLNQQGYYGRVLGRIFDTSSANTLTDLTGRMNFTLDPMANYDDMVREVKKVFPFTHKKLSGAYGHFVPNTRGDIKATEIAVKSNLKGSPHAKSTLVHETGHGIDWMNSAKHDCARTVADLRDNCFPNLTLQEVQDIMDSELKDTMCQVRHAVVMDDVRLADSEAEAKLLEDKTSPAALERLKKAPAQVDYIKLRSDLLSEVEESIKSKRYTETGKPIETLGQFKNVMDREAIKYSDTLMEGAKSAQELDEFVARKVTFVREFLLSRDSDATTLYRSSWKVPVTPYNFNDWAQQFFVRPIDPALKKDIVNYVKLSWMQKCESHCWAGDISWSKRPTERWAVFVQSLYIDPERTAEIAPKAYKAFMENMRTNKYASVLGRLLGFRAVV